MFMDSHGFSSEYEDWDDPRSIWPFANYLSIIRPIVIYSPEPQDLYAFQQLYCITLLVADKTNFKTRDSEIFPIESTGDLERKTQ